MAPISGFRKGSDLEEEEHGPLPAPSGSTRAAPQRSSSMREIIDPKVDIKDTIAKAIFDALTKGKHRDYFSSKYVETIANGIAESANASLQMMPESPTLGQSITRDIYHAIDWQGIPQSDVSDIILAIQSAIKSTDKGRKINFPQK